MARTAAKVRARAASLAVSTSTRPSPARTTVTFAKACRKKTPGAISSVAPVGFQSS